MAPCPECRTSGLHKMDCSRRREQLLAIDGLSHPTRFYAGVAIVGGYVAQAAPILSYMRGWSEQRVLDYCRRQHWTATRLG